MAMIMDARRSRGEGSLSWNDARQRWIGRVSLGYLPNGKRRIGTVSAKTKTEAKNKLRALIRDKEDGLPIAQRGYTVADAVESWLHHGLVGRDPSTIANRRSLAKTHLLPDLGRERLAQLTAEDVDAWLGRRSATLSRDTMQRLLSILRHSIRRAQARDLVKRNVAMLCDVPKGAPGRPSKSLTLAEALKVLAAAENYPAMHAYVVVSLLTGARTEELRALTWAHVDLEGSPTSQPPIPPSISLWRSVRRGGDTKTANSRRTLELPHVCVDALRAHRLSYLEARRAAGERWQDTDLVFTTRLGTALDAANVRRSFRKVVAEAGLDASAWTPRELRHSFVSLLSSIGMPIEEISHLVGHANTRVTEQVYRKELRPMLTRGASAMDALFGEASGRRKVSS